MSFWVPAVGSILSSVVALWAISREDHPWSPRRRRWPARVAAVGVVGAWLLALVAAWRGPLG